MKPTLTLQLDGAALAVEHVPQAGAAVEPVVFLHAGVGDSRMWESQRATVGPLRSTLRYDRRGFGASRVLHAVAHSPVADLVAVLDAIGVPRAVFVAGSQGGRIALDLALADPARVAAMLLVAPAVSGAPEPELEGPAAALSEAIEAADEQRGDADAVNELEAQLWLDGPTAPAGRVGGEARALFLDMNGIALRSPDPGDEIEPPSAWQRLGNVRCPSWIVWGDLDLPEVQNRCEQLARRIAGARAEPLPGTAHLPMLEASDRFNAVLGRFLSA